jgi:hypothetical protein
VMAKNLRSAQQVSSSSQGFSGDGVSSNPKKKNGLNKNNKTFQVLIF